MHPKTMTMVFLAALAVREHDRQVISRYVAEGLIDSRNLDPAVWYKDDVKEDIMNNKDELLVSSFETGISEEPRNQLLKRVREIREVLDHSVRKHFDLPEVKEWLDGIGGLDKLDEKLVTRARLRQYKRDLKALRRAYGEIPTPIGQATSIYMDSATNYSGYAVEAHRLDKTRKAYGEVHDPDEDVTEKDWTVDQYDVSLSGDNNKPSWWKNNAAIGRKKVDCTQKLLARLAWCEKQGKKPVFKFVQTEHDKWTPWSLDLRYGEVVGGKEFQFLEKVMPVHQIEDHPVVRKLIDTFYNEPGRLEWVRTSYEKNGELQLGRWAFGMAVKGGKYVWGLVSTRTHETMLKRHDWQQNKELQYLRPVRCLFLDDWIVTFTKPYGMKGWKELIEVRYYRKAKEDDDVKKVIVTKHGPIIMDTWRVVHYKEWGTIKKTAILKGAQEGFTGYNSTWKVEVAEPVYTEPKEQMPEGFVEI